MESGEIAQALSEKKPFKNHTILYAHIAQLQGQITFRGQILIIIKTFTTLIIHCKFQPIVFNTF